MTSGCRSRRIARCRCSSHYAAALTVAASFIDTTSTMLDNRKCDGV